MEVGHPLIPLPRDKQFPHIKGTTLAGAGKSEKNKQAAEQRKDKRIR